MLKRIGKIGLFVAYVGGTHLFAYNDLAHIASEQEILAHKIVKAYRSNNQKAFVTAIRKLEAGHATLASNIHNRELKNLLVYLDLCLKDLEKLSKAPHNRTNAGRIAELSDSISEGNRYILSSL